MPRKDQIHEAVKTALIETNARVFERKALREITARSGISLLVVNLITEEIVQWKP